MSISYNKLLETTSRQDSVFSEFQTMVNPGSSSNGSQQQMQTAKVYQPVIIIPLSFEIHFQQHQQRYTITISSSFPTRTTQVCLPIFVEVPPDFDCPAECYKGCLRILCQHANWKICAELSSSQLFCRITGCIINLY